MNVLLAHPGTQYSHRLALQLAQRQLLYRFYTGFAIAENGPGHLVLRAAGKNLQKKLSNRLIHAVPSSKLQIRPLLEWKALKKLKAGHSSEQVFYERNKRFQESIPDSALKKADVVIGFDSSGWLLAERCKQMGRRFILDVSIAHPINKQQVFETIIKRYPEWTFALPQKENHLIALEAKEMELSDYIVVASSFSKQTLVENGVPPSKIGVNAYGVDAVAFNPATTSHLLQGGVSFLFTGLVDARKGVPLLLDVWSKIETNTASLTLVGPVADDVKQKALQYKNVTITGKIPFKEMPALMQQFQVFVFPSYFEGFGLVILEAMASGMPVITTTATCGADIIEDGKEGFVIEPGNDVQLQKAMQFFIDHPSSILSMGEAARKKAERYSWEAYGERWEQIIRNQLV